MSNLQFWSTKQGKTNTTENYTDEAETTKKDPIEEKIVDNDPEIGPVVDEDPSPLDEEPEVDQLESPTATEAWGEVSQTAGSSWRSQECGCKPTINQGSWGKIV